MVSERWLGLDPLLVKCPFGSFRTSELGYKSLKNDPLSSWFGNSTYPDISGNFVGETAFAGIYIFNYMYPGEAAKLF